MQMTKFEICIIDDKPGSKSKNEFLVHNFMLTGENTNSTTTRSSKEI